MTEMLLEDIDSISLTVEVADWIEDTAIAIATCRHSRRQTARKNTPPWLSGLRVT